MKPLHKKKTKNKLNKLMIKAIKMGVTDTLHKGHWLLLLKKVNSKTKNKAFSYLVKQKIKDVPKAPLMVKIFNLSESLKMDRNELSILFQNTLKNRNAK